MKKIILILLFLSCVIAANANEDTDGDGVLDNVDAFPNDNSEWLDTDGDGIGNNTDDDDDNDGRDDGLEMLLGTDPLDDNDPKVPRAFFYLVTSPTGQNITELHIVNTAVLAQGFKGSLYDGDGGRLGAANQPLHQIEIASNGRLILQAEDLEEIFSVEAWSGPALLEVSADEPFLLMSKLTSPSGHVSNTNCVRASTAINIEGFDTEDQTYVRLINTGDMGLGEIRGTFHDSSGEIIGAQDVLLTGSLEPKQAVWLSRSGIRDLIGEWQGEAMLTVDSFEGLKILNLNFVNQETFFNFSCFEGNESGRVYLQTASGSQNISATHIVNTDNASQLFTGTLFSKDGTQLGTTGVSLQDEAVPVNGRLILTSSDLETLFEIDSWAGPALLEVSGTGEFDLMTKLESPSGLISNTNCVRQGSVHNVQAPGSLEVSYVRVINQGDNVVGAIYGTLFDSSGNAIGNPDQVIVENLAPREGVWLTSQRLADLFDSNWGGDATLKVIGPSHITLIDLIFTSEQTFFNFSCFEADADFEPEFDETDVPTVSVSDDSVNKGQTVTFTVAAGERGTGDPQGDQNIYMLLVDEVAVGTFDGDGTLELVPPLGETDYTVQSISSRNTGVSALGNTLTVESVIAEEEDSVVVVVTGETRNTTTTFSIDATLGIQILGPDPSSSTGTCEAFQNDSSLGTFALTVGGVLSPNTHTISGATAFLQSKIGGPGTYIFDTWDLIEIKCTTTNSTGAISTFVVFTNEGNHICPNGCRKNN